ncbi:MAG: hypothetical protein ACYC9Q_12035 [Bacillota bacterium]
MPNMVEIPIDGVRTRVERIGIQLEKLKLDRTNPRIQYFLDSRLEPEVTDEHLKQALAEGNDQYQKLKGHIEVNGGIYNAIWVVAEDESFRVIEGNTRALVYMELAEKYVNDPKWKTIDSFVLPHEVEPNKINFIRLEAHLFGATPWDAYEKARELHRLHTEEYYSLKRLQQLTKLSEHDIRVTIKAFEDMTGQYLKKYPRPGETLKFSYFAEFHKNKDLQQLVRERRITLDQFCDLVGNGKLGRGEHVRKLAMVWKDDEARSELLDADGNMESALDQLSEKDPGARSRLFEKIDDVTDGLVQMPWSEVDEIKRGLHAAKSQALLKLYGTLKQFLRDTGVLDHDGE